MLSDALVNFSPVGSPTSLISVVGDVVLPGIYDILGTGPGTQPPVVIGNPSSGVFGSDIGVGGVRPELCITIGDALTSGGAATVNFKLQAAPDTAVSHAVGAWTTINESGPIAIASLTSGSIPYRVPFLPAFPANLEPRYFRLVATIAGATTTAGSVASAIVTMYRDDQGNKFAANNFSV